MALLFPSRDPSHGREDPKGAARRCRPARSGSPLGQRTRTHSTDQAESCPGGQVPERRAAPGAAGPWVQNRIMTHLQAEAT